MKHCLKLKQNYLFIATLLLGLSACGGGGGGSSSNNDTDDSTAIPDVTSNNDASDNPGWVSYQFDGDLFRIKAVQGAQPENVSSALDALSSGEDTWLSISPDGSRILIETTRFHEDCEGWACLAVVNFELSNGEAVLSNETLLHSEGHGAISNTGLVVYPFGGGTNQLDIWAINEGSSTATPILLTQNSPFQWNDLPSISEDGNKILFNCGDIPYGGSGTQICEVNTDGSGFRIAIELSNLPQNMTSAFALRHADYSNNGSIVFEGEWDGSEVIARLESGATQPTIINNAFSNDNSPCILPNGDIASLWLGSINNLAGNHELKLMNSDGSSFFMLFEGGDISDTGLSCY